MVHESGALPVWHEYEVVPAMIYDSIILGSDRIDVNVTHIGNTEQTANDNGADINAILEDTATTIPGTITTIDNEIAVIDGIVDSILEDTGTTLDTLIRDVPTVAEFEARTIVSANYATAAALTTVDNEIAVIDGIVDDILIDTSTTLDTLRRDVPTVAEFEARSLPAPDYTIVSDLPVPPTANAIADQVWDEAISGHTGAGTTGNALSTASSGGVDPAVLADAIWDEAVSGHTTAGTAGKVLQDAATATALATVDGIVDNILEDTGTTLDTLIRDVPTVAEFEARTIVSANYATAAALTTVDNEIAVIDGIVDSILEDTATTIPASIAALPTDADVNAQVVDALATDTYAEPAQGAPAATLSLASKIAYLYKAWRNKTTSDADSIDIYNDAGAVVDQKAVISDNGTTFTRGEMGTGA
jgi:hypothetical protein